jgi:hypothetical protein
MVIVPLSKTANDSALQASAPETKSASWAGIAAGGTLMASGLLLLTGQRRAGLVAAAAGATLAVLDQKETVRTWWHLLPGYIDNVQKVLSQVQAGVEEFAVKRDKVRQILTR